MPFRMTMPQARADAAPLAVTMIVVALVAFLTAVVPREIDRVSTHEIRTAVANPNSQSSLVVNVPLVGDFGSPGPATIGTPGDSVWIGDFLTQGLPPIFDKPIVQITSGNLQIGKLGTLPATMRLEYVYGEGESGVTWVQGRAPGGTKGAYETDAADGTFPIEIGLSEESAKTLGVEVGT